MGKCKKLRMLVYQKCLLFILLIFIHEISLASACTNVFPAAIQGNTSNVIGELLLDCGTQIVNNPSTVLNFDTLAGPGFGCGTKTCVTDNCTVSGNRTPQLDAGLYQNSSGAGGSVNIPSNPPVTVGGINNTVTDYDQIFVNSSGALNFSTNPTNTTVYRINTLGINNGGIVNFSPGDYWINTLNINGDATFTVQENGTARLFVRNPVTVTGTQQWNVGQSASKLLYYAYGFLSLNVTDNKSSQVNAIIYLNQDDFFAGNNTVITGSISTDDLTLYNNAKVIYDSNAVNNMDFGFMCPRALATTQFKVDAPATGTNCQSMVITVTAKDTNGQTVPSYTGAISVTTQSGSGSWVSTTGGGTLNNAGNGVGTYQFVSGDNGVVSFQLNYPASGLAPIRIQAFQTNNSAVSGLSNQINFIPTSILVTAVAVQNPPASSPPAFATTQVAGNPFTVFLTAYNPSNCGIINSYSGSKTLRFSTNFVNPTTGTLNASINGTNIANSQAASQTTQVINFTNGVATVTGNYPDVGILMLNVQDVTSGGPTGISGNFIVMPAQFIVNIPNDNASQVFSPIGSAISSCLADSVFAAAGRSFTVNVQPQNLQGNATPNYGNETPAQGIIIQSAALLAPNPGQNGSANNGIIANGSAFTKITGGASPFSPSSFPYFTGSNFSFDEVGCISLAASVAGGSYLGAGNVVSSPLVVGRFIPDHFDATSNVPQFLTPNNKSASGSFTYLDQPFKYNTQPILTIVARALSGTTTQNYTGSFWKLTSMNFNPQYFKLTTPITATDSLPELTLFPVIPTPTFIDGGNGTGTFTYDGGSLTIQRPTLLPLKPVPPFKADIQLQIPTITDPDGVSCSGVGCTLGGFAFGSLSLGGGIPFTGNGIGNQFFHGRLNIFDTIGSELLSMTVPLQTEFYTTANGFSINKLDSDTTLSSIASVLLTPNPSGLSTNKFFNPATGLLQFGSISINLTPPTLKGISAPGFFGIEVDLSATGLNLPWLQFNWTYNGPATAYNVNPRAAAIFGVFEGNSRIIYEAEIFQ